MQMFQMAFPIEICLCHSFWFSKHNRLQSHFLPSIIVPNVKLITILVLQIYFSLSSFKQNIFILKMFWNNKLLSKKLVIANFSLLQSQSKMNRKAVIHTLAILMMLLGLSSVNFMSQTMYTWSWIQLVLLSW